jgi:hypothetical protein
MQFNRLWEFDASTLSQRGGYFLSSSFVSWGFEIKSSCGQKYIARHARAG